MFVNSALDDFFGVFRHQKRLFLVDKNIPIKKLRSNKISDTPQILYNLVCRSLTTYTRKQNILSNAHSKYHKKGVLKGYGKRKIHQPS